ncbi:unnamed protein product, partial [Medioppia subpectinata]
MSHKITHVLFDLDGTLVNTIDILIEVFREFAQSYGKILSNEIERGVANLTDIPIFFDKVIDSLDLPRNKSIDRPAVHKEFMRQLYLKEAQLIPGVERLVKHLHKHRVPIAIATGN